MNTLRVFNHYVHIRVLLLGTVELLWLVGSVYAAVFIRFGLSAAEMAEDPILLFMQALLFTVAVLMGMVAMGVYQPQRRDGHLQVSLRVAGSFVLAWMGLFLVFYVAPILHLGRGVTVLGSVIGFSGVLVIELWDYRVGQRHEAPWRILFYGAGHQAASIFSQLRRRSDHRYYTLVGCVPVADETIAIENELVVETGGSLLEYSRAQEVDEIVVAMDNRRGKLPSADLMACRMAGINVVDELTFYEQQTGKIKTELLSPGWLIFSHGFRQTRLQNAAKRGLDLIFATAMLVVFSPIMLLTAVGIWIEDGLRAPVFFTQTRVGRNGREFRLFKFRSMRTDAEKAGMAQWATTNDARITQAGTFIRKHRFDELPQLWNVIKGDMSLVGPRPERPEFVCQLAEKMPFYPVRHQVRPGITGWAQVSYPYGASEEDANAKLQLDLYYVKNRSTFLDFLILLGTIEAVLFQKGAR